MEKEFFLFYNGSGEKRRLTVADVLCQGCKDLVQRSPTSDEIL